MPPAESEAKAKTKVRFEEIFRSHSGLTEKKKSKKQKFHSHENIVLDTFRNNLDLAKESGNDEVIINNTYNPEEKSPRFTKNKLRDKASVAEKINNDVVSGEENKQPKSNKKKKKAVLQEQFNEEEKVYETKLESFEKQITDLPKKKTKSKSQTDASRQKGNNKIKSTLNEARDVTELEEEEQLIQAYQLQVAEDEANIIKEKIRKKLKEQMSEFTSSVQSQKVVLNNEVGKKKKKKKEVPVVSEAETSAMSLAELQHNPLEDNPRKKKSSGRLLASYFKDEMNTEEHKEEEDVEKLKPKIKKAKKKSPKGLCNQNIIVKILDFLSMDEARANSEVQIKESGFRKISWAFLKLVGANGVLNIDGKLRLQLYYPPPRTRTQSNVVEVFDWWAKGPRNRYPSTLYVTVKGIKLPDHVDPSFRSMMAVQQEQGSTSFRELQNEVSKKATVYSPHEKKEQLKWTRLPGQACRIPNKHLFSLRAGDMGCFCIRFSQDGKTLAAACAGRDGYPIILYEIPSGQYLREFYGHLNIVYDLCWSKDNEYLLTASSDGTVRMWKIETQATTSVRVFPHPSFVYTAKYHPVADYLVVTGCYDSVIRVWNTKVKELYGQLLQEFDGHKSFINTLCFDAEGLHMFSGDSSGLIIVWNTFVKGSSQHPVQHWSINKEIKENDIKGTPINHLEVHPNGRRLLIHAKDSALRIMDLRILATKKYIGATNYREKIHSTLTPCGTFLFSGSEDGIAYVWNPETGDQVAMYSDLSFTFPVRDVAFHPHEHMVSFCAFGQNQPILVYIYDYKVAQQEAEIVKDLNGSLASTTPRGPQILSNSSHISAQKDSTMSPADQFVSVARVSMRMQKVKQKLDSVMTSSNLMLPAPSLLSPHSKLRLPSTLGTSLIPQCPFMSQNGSFSPVGSPLSRTPSVRLQTSDDLLVTSCMRGANNSTPVQEIVVALYDYTAHRSDELTIHRSDIIQVLYKDNDNWWFGSLANGQQGYFPANYVAGETEYEKEQSSELVPDSTPLLHHEQTEAEVRYPAPHGMSAVITKSGDLKFISEHDTDIDSPVTQVTKKKKRILKNETMENPPNLMALDTPVSSSTTNSVENKPRTHGLELKKKKRAVKNSSASGKTNVAFEPDS
ncbi:jouberin [Terrapene carolina triunguis]|uniref:jouberin n=1 Tax=Terrapene triunguis TaxID=2587831 RepID=UPI000E77B65F|nr:jouberin [Terrapene carolina triunguis]